MIVWLCNIYIYILYLNIVILKYVYVCITNKIIRFSFHNPNWRGVPAERKIETENYRVKGKKNKNKYRWNCKN